MTLVCSDFPRKQTKARDQNKMPQYHCYLLEMLSVVIWKEKGNVNEWSITSAKDLVKENDGSDLKIYPDFKQHFKVTNN